MSAEYRIDLSEGVVYEVYKGTVAVEELIEMIKREHADPQYVPGMPIIIDLTEKTNDWDYFQIHQLSNFINSLFSGMREKVKCALVGPSEPEKSVLKVLGIMYEASDVKVKMRICADKKEALAWVKGEA